MVNQNWWFTTLLIKQFKYCPPLGESITNQTLYDETSLKIIIGAEKFTAGIRYGGTYGINPLLAIRPIGARSFTIEGHATLR